MILALKIRSPTSDPNKVQTDLSCSIVKASLGFPEVSCSEIGVSSTFSSGLS